MVNMMTTRGRLFLPAVLVYLAMLGTLPAAAQTAQPQPDQQAVQQQARQPGQQGQQKGEVWTGVVRKSGNDYVLISQDGLPRILHGQAEELAKLESQRVQVAGTASGATIDVQRILAAPISMGGTTGEKGMSDPTREAQQPENPGQEGQQPQGQPRQQAQ